MVKVLITGGAGFIGSHICKELIQRGHTPIILDGFIRYISPLKDNINISFKERFEGILDKIIIERGFTDNYETVLEVILRHKPEYIIHLAALPLAKLPNINVKEAQDGTITSTANILSIINKVKSITQFDFKRFLYTSSSMVYGNFSSQTAVESDPKNPMDIYGTLKLAGENVTRGLSKAFNIDYTIIRPSAVYGPLDSNRRVSQIFVENALFGKDIKVYGEDEKLDFSYVKDVAIGFIQALFHENGANETFNITSGKARSLLEFANILKESFPEVTISIVERDAQRPKRGTLDISKAQRLIEFQPKYSLREGITEYIEYMKKKKNENPTL